MADTNVPVPLLPAHIEETIRSIDRIHAYVRRLMARERNPALTYLLVLE